MPHQFITVRFGVVDIKNLLSLSLGLVGIEGAVVHSGDLHERQSLHNLVLLLSHADGDLLD